MTGAVISGRKYVLRLSARKAEHFLGHDVGHLADAARDQRERLQNRCPDLLKRKPTHNRPDCLFDMAPSFKSCYR